MRAGGIGPDRRHWRWCCAIVALASTLATSLLAAVAPSGCTSIAAIPVAKAIQYGAGIQTILINFNGLGMGCADCHTTLGGTVQPSGNLDLDPVDSPSPYVNLINVPSFDAPELTYVVPGHPEQSLLFQKVNCDTPGEQARMPLDNYGGGLSVEQQALIYDWIAAGAPVGTTDAIFRGTFDVRGFDQ